MAQPDHQDHSRYLYSFHHCLVLPRNEGRQFRYDVGKPWMYGSVIATFDFPIYKTDEAIKHEQDSLLRQFQPYYTVKSNVGNEQIKRFLHDFNQGIPGLPKEYVELIANQLKQVYQTGIVSTPEYNRIYKDSTSMIRIISGKNAKSFPIGNFYSTIAAYEHIFFDEKISAQRQILSRCNLNDYVEPNLIYDKERSEAERTDLLSSIPLASGMVMSGQKIIDRGEVINDYTYRVLNSFDKGDEAPKFYGGRAYHYHHRPGTLRTAPRDDVYLLSHALP